LLLLIEFSGDKILKKKVILFFCILFFGQNLALSCANPSGNFEKSELLNEIRYYPGTSFSLHVTNLSVGYYYGIQIGANQFVYNQQWINFTAGNFHQIITFSHFINQEMIDNQSNPISHLLIYLWSIDSNSDTSPTKLDTYTLIVNNYSDSWNTGFIGTILYVGLIFVVMITGILVLLRLFFKK